MIGEPTRELDDFERASDLACGVGQHLAVLGGDRSAEIGAVAIDELAETEQHLGTLRERRGPPRGERGRGFVDRGTDLVGRREVDLPRLDPRRRVVHRTGPARGARYELASDPMRDALHPHSLPQGASGWGSEATQEVSGRCRRVVKETHRDARRACR